MRRGFVTRVAGLKLIFESGWSVWLKTGLLGSVLVACAILDFACGGGGGGGGGGGRGGGLPPAATSAGGIPSGAIATHFATSQAEIFRLGSGFSPTGSMVQRRAAAGATRLGDGTVFFAGGLIPGGDGPTVTAIIGLGTGGTINPNENVELIFTQQGGTQIPIEHATTSTDSTSQIAAALANSISNNPQLKALGISATPQNDDIAIQQPGAIGNSSVVSAAFPSSSVTVKLVESATSAAEIYDPGTQSFSNLGNMSEPRAFQVTALLNNGTVLLAGGAQGTTDGLAFTAVDSAEIYNPFIQQFLKTAGSLTTGRMSAGWAVLPDGSVLIVGGTATFDGVSPLTGLTSAEVYDPASRTFSSVGDMGVGRVAPSVAPLNNGMVLVAGGDNQPPTTAQLYDPKKQTFAPFFIPAGLPDNLAVFSFRPSGNLLVTGGTVATQHQIVPPSGPPAQTFIFEDPVGSIETYAPGGAFSADPATLSTPRSLHQTTLLDSGQALITGGVVNNDVVMQITDAALQDPTFDPSAYICGSELYTDSSTPASVPAGKMHLQRAVHSAIELQDGSVLIAGGYYCGSVSTESGNCASPPTCK